MTLTNPTLLTAAVTATTETALTSGSFTPTGGALLVAVANLAVTTSSGSTTWAVSDTLGGLSWTQVTVEYLPGGGGSNDVRASVFYAFAPGSPSAGTVTVTPSRTGDTVAGETLSVYQVAGAISVRQTTTASNNTNVVTFASAPLSTSLVFAVTVTALAFDPGQAAPSGFTALVTDRHTGTYTWDSIAYRASGTPQTFNWGGSSFGNASMGALEIVGAPPLVATKSAVPFSLAVTIGGVDVTSYVRLDANIGITRWRQDEDAEITASQCGFDLDNSLGYFTPGATSGPLANAVVVDAVVQVSQVVNGVTYYRFTGFVDEWDAQLEGGVLGVCTVTATDAYGRAGTGSTLKSYLRETALYGNGTPPLHLWPLDDPAGSATAQDATMSGSEAATLTATPASGGSAAFGSTAGLYADEGGAALTLTATGSTGYYLSLPADCWQSASLRYLSVFFRTTVTTVGTQKQRIMQWLGHSTDVAGLLTLQRYEMSVQINGDGTLSVLDSEGSTPVTSGASVADGKWHQLVVPLPSTGAQLAPHYVRLDDLPIALFQPYGNAYGGSLTVGTKTAAWSGDLAYVASSTSPTTYYGAAVTADAGVSTTARMQALAAFRGWPVAAMSSLNTVGPAVVSGQTLQQAARDVGTAEGTVTYVDGQGNFGFPPQTATWNPTPAVTLDATTDPITADYSVRLDRQDVLNDVTVQRPGGTDQRYAITAPVVSQKTIAAPLPSDAASLALAQWTVNAQSTPQPRSPSFTVDLMNLATTAKVQALLATTPLSAVQVTNLPSVYPSPANYLIQGEQEAIGVDVWTLTCFTSPVPGGVLIADNSATWVDGAFGAAW